MAAPRTRRGDDDGHAGLAGRKQRHCGPHAANHRSAVTNFIFNTARRQLTAVLAGVRRAIFNLNLSFLTHTTGSNGRLFGRDIELVLTAQAASTLNSVLGVSGFKAGEHFGT